MGEFKETIDTVEELFQRVEKKILRYRRHSEWEDLLQEGRLIAWAAFDTGVRDARTLLNKATNRAGSIVSGRSQPAGKPEKSHDFTRSEQGEATRYKIRSFLDQFVALHDRQPTHSEISRGVGIKTPNVKHHMNRLYSGPTSDEVRVIPIDDFYAHNPGEHSLDMYAWEDSFEDETVDRLVVSDLMSQLREKERKAVHLRYWEDQSYPAITQALGSRGKTAQVGANWVNMGIASLRSMTEEE